MHLAEHACEASGNIDLFPLDSLAAAYAEAGRFEKARLTAQEAIYLAQSSGYEKLLKDVEKRLQICKSAHPFRNDLSLKKTLTWYNP